MSQTKRITGDLTLDPSGNLVVLASTAITGNTTVTGDLTVSGTATVDTLDTQGVQIVDNNIRTTRTNDDLVLDPSGTGLVSLVAPSQTSVGAAGAGDALPATPSGYVKVKINGSEYVMPYYAA